MSKQSLASQSVRNPSETSEVLYEKTIEVRWADCDANRHMRHTAYSDMAAHTRVGFLTDMGLTSEWFQEHSIGPVLFKEETEYKSEVHMDEMLRICVDRCEPTGYTKSVQLVQSIYKSNGELAAVHRCVIGMMDLNVRKIVDLPAQIKQYMPVSVLEEVN